MGVTHSVLRLQPGAILSVYGGMVSGAVRRLVILRLHRHSKYSNGIVMEPGERSSEHSFGTMETALLYVVGSHQELTEARIALIDLESRGVSGVVSNNLRPGSLTVSGAQNNRHTQLAIFWTNTTS